MPPVRYTIRFPSPQSHYAEVDARIPSIGRQQFEVFLPVWTPGSYLVREYARHVEALSAWDSESRPLSVRKTRKNRWLVELDKALDEVIITYHIYCHELSVRTNWVDENFALIIGAASFLAPAGRLDDHYEVTVELPEGWSGVWTGLPGSGHTFSAPDYHTLVDCPIVAGNPNVFQRDVDGIPHYLVNVGDDAFWDAPKALEDLAAIVRQHVAMFGALPYRNYFVFNLLTGARGGLEHCNSMVVMADRLTMRTRSSYAAWLDLVSHEHFHVWNVKRLRPKELALVDYENEVYTTNLWIAEGFTEYYGLLNVRRAGLSTDEEFLSGTEEGSLSWLIEKVQNTPGRLQHPVAAASFDAWIKLYRPDENSINSSISYYTKGGVIAWLLDAHIREATGDTRSLDDVLRLSFERFGSSVGYSTEEFIALAEQVADKNLNDWFKSCVESTAELDYSSALAWFGLCFKPGGSHSAPGLAPQAWPGFSTKSDGGRLTVTQVPRNSPGWIAGVSPGDEILAIDNFRVLPADWDQLMLQYRPNEQIILLVSRSRRLTSLRMRLGKQPDPWILEIDPSADSEQKQHLSAWLDPNPGLKSRNP